MKRILITGAAGYIGSQLAAYLNNFDECEVVGVDLHPPKQDNFMCEQMDIRDPDISELMKLHEITHVVHLASVVNPGKDDKLDYDIDVNGTDNLLRACAKNKIRHITVTSSGAAYGYYPDNPEWLSETDPIRGNEAFSYSRHKRLVECLLARHQEQYAKTGILIMRPCTVLGSRTRNRITELFDRKKVLAIGESESPFVFIWDQDVIMALAHGVLYNKTGAYNLAGDGKVTVSELAGIMKKDVQRISPLVLKALLWLGQKLGLSHTGPEQIVFLQYRPVLSNRKLKDEFGYIPQKSSKDVFEFFWRNRQQA